MSRLFSSATDKVDFGSITDSVPMTCWAWVYPTATILNQQQVIGCYSTASSNYWRLHCRQTNLIVFEMTFSTTNAFAQSSTDEMQLNTWNFVAGSTNSTTVNVYHGTSPENIATANTTVTNPVGTHTDSADNLIIGNCGSDDDLFVGRIENAGWIDKELTLNELKAIAWRGHPARNDFKLFATLGGLHTVEPDMSGNGGLGTVTGAVRANGSPTLPFIRGVNFLIDDNGAIGYVEPDPDSIWTAKTQASTTWSDKAKVTTVWTAT